MRKYHTIIHVLHVVDNVYKCRIKLLKLYIWIMDIIHFAIVKIKTESFTQNFNTD